MTFKKYEKVFREDYEKWYRANEAYRNEVKADPDRLSYHLMPETGWLNDPNGLCQFKGEYHIYYQYTPFEPTGELKLWGHYRTRDFVHFDSCEPVLFPDSDEDAHGVYSGSAFSEGDTIYYFYTGNVKLFDRPDYDYIMAGRLSNTLHVTSRDGFHFSPKQLLMSNKDYPSDISAHVRDPKVIRREDGCYMVLGARDEDSRGLVLVYRSQDLERWEYHGRIVTKEAFGYMWECPDLFLLDGKLCLICCPQGVEKSGLDFWNVHQCTAVVLDYDFRPGTWELPDRTAIHMLDRGFDFYAPQTFEDEKGRRILIGWMGIPDASYTNPTVKKGWQHALTLPRQLHLEGDRLIQEPMEEMKALRKGCRSYENGKSLKEEHALCCEILVDFTDCTYMKLELRKGVWLTWEDHILSLKLGVCGSGRDTRKVEIERLNKLHIFSDTTSLEIFINEGREVFTTRVYGQESGLSLDCDGKVQVVVYDLAGLEYRKATS